MTATLSAPVTVPSIVLMTEAEARACVEEIRSGMENVMERVIQLHDREGWKALKYDSWTACIHAELNMSRSRAYQLLDLAQINGALSTIVDTPIPETHAREMAVIKDDPARVRTVYTELLEETGGKPTQSAVRKKVDKVLSRPARETARAVIDTQLSRPSVRSERDPSDSQVMPDDDQSWGFEPDTDGVDGQDLGAADINQEIYPKSKAQPSQRCGICTKHFSGLVCPCTAVSTQPVIHDAEAAPIQESAPAVYGAPERREPESRQELQTAEARYWSGMADLLALTELDPAAIVPLIPLDFHQDMRDTHGHIRKWLADLDYQIFLAEQRGRQGAA